jgi:hypothetical protein
LTYLFIDFGQIIFGKEVSVIGRVDVGNVKESVATNPKINKNGLDRGFDVDDSTFVNVPNITFLRSPLEIKFFERAIFDDGDPTLL